MQGALILIQVRIPSSAVHLQQQRAAFLLGLRSGFESYYFEEIWWIEIRGCAFDKEGEETFRTKSDTKQNG